MAEILKSTPEGAINMDRIADMGRVTVLEALAEPTEAIDISRSNRSTPPAGDADDQ